jgi:hypothetical protein
MKRRDIGMNVRANKGCNSQANCVAAILALCLFMASFARAEQPSTPRFDIDSESLSSALNQFAQQSREQILFAPDLVAHKRSTALHASLEPHAALKLLLKDSGLTFTTTATGTILVGNPAERPNSKAFATPNPGNSSHSNSSLATITVQGERERDFVRHKIKTYISAIEPLPGQPLGRWERYAPLCPLAAGLPRTEGEYILKKVSQIAVESGAPMGRAHCKVNLYFVFSSHPDALIDAWSHRDPWMFDDTLHQGGTVIRHFLHATTAVRTWYNIFYTSFDGLPMAMMSDTAHAWGGLVHDLWSVIVIIDARRAKGVSYDQLAAYIAMVGLAQIRLDGKLDDAPTILHLFSDPEKAPQGLSEWDKSYLKYLYAATPSGIRQRLEIARSMVADIAP